MLTLQPMVLAPFSIRYFPMKILQKHFFALVISVVFTLLSLSGNIAVDAGEPYSWPIESPTRVTSTFGEFRGSHLHNGIDFSTLNRPGRTVRAIDTGFVDEVFHDPRRYGKTVILKHPDGRRSWYSHLASIDDRLKEQLGGFPAAYKEFSPDNEIVVSRSQTLGIAGQTGRGGLHLHLALQAKNGDFLNPIGRFQPALSFNVKPVLESVRFFALDSSGWIDGNPYAVEFDELPRRAIKVWGKIGVNLNVWNRHPGTVNRSLPASIQVLRDGNLVFERRFDRMSVEQQKEHVSTVFDVNRSHLAPTVFTLQMTPQTRDFSWEGLNFQKKGKRGTLEFILESKNGQQFRGKIPYKTVPPPTTFEWFPEQVSDAADTVPYRELTKIQPVSSKFLMASLQNRQTALEQYSPPQYSDRSNNPRVELDDEWLGNRLKISVRIEGGWQGWPRLLLRQNGFVQHPPLIQVKPGKFVTWWKPDLSREGWYEIEVSARGNQGTDTATSRVFLQSIHRSREGAIVSMDGRYSLFYGGEGVSISSFVQFQTVDLESHPTERSIQPVEKPYRISPDFIQSVKPFVLSVDLPDTLAKPREVGLYRWNNAVNEWNVLSYKRGISRFSREANFRQTGTIGLFRDDSSPSIKKVERISPETVRIHYREAESGIDPDSISTIVSGASLQAVHDPYNRQIDLSISEQSSVSSRVLIVTIQDRAGHRAEWQGKVENIP